MRRTTVLAALLPLLSIVTACGVQSDGSPRDLPDAEQKLENPSVVSGDVAAGASRIYLIAPGEDRLLRSVSRQADTASDLIDTLLRGPNDNEVEAQYNTAIPSTTDLNQSPRISGQTMTVDLTPDIVELNTPSLIRAVAQIVYTATELPGVETVLIEIDGEPLPAPTPTGDATTKPLSVYDYPLMVVSSQPAFPAAPVSGTT